MNWKKQAHLFTNGRFKIRLPEGTIETFKPHHQWVNDCTLIARPISDMSDAEIKNWQGIPGLTGQECAELREELIAKANSHALTLTEFLCITREGIYPFDQADFDKGYVIPRQKII